MTKLRSILTIVAGGLVAICGYSNIFRAYRLESGLPPANLNALVIKERRLEPIREILLMARYSGGVGFIRMGDIQGLPWFAEDEGGWGQSQYVMLPWVLVNGNRTAPFVLAAYDVAPGPELPGYSRVYDDGMGIALFHARQMPP
jgi:hypothetical protein